MSVKWQRGFEIGVVEIDLQHQELFSKLGDLLDAIERGRGQKILSDFHGYLDSYTRKHFTAEEALQHKFKYPHVATHCEEHKIFIKNLEHLKSRTVEDGPSDALVKLTRDTLVNWLIQHICSTDKRLGEYVNLHRNLQWEEWLKSQF